jgi:hypothetical protein
MSRQLSLFDLPKPTPAPPLAASADPETSRLAAAKVRAKADDQASRVAALVKSHPGRTSHELASVATDRDLDRSTIAKRLSVAESRGLIRRGDARPCTVTGNAALTWFPV